MNWCRRGSRSLYKSDTEQASVSDQCAQVRPWRWTETQRIEMVFTEESSKSVLRMDYDTQDCHEKVNREQMKAFNCERSLLVPYVLVLVLVLTKLPGKPSIDRGAVFGYLDEYVSPQLADASFAKPLRTSSPSRACLLLAHRLTLCLEQTMSQPQTQWLFYAIASGGCAALNGVFAKLTTTQLTTTWATAISHLIGMSGPSRFVELLVRGVCQSRLWR